MAAAVPLDTSKIKALINNLDARHNVFNTVRCAAALQAWLGGKEAPQTSCHRRARLTALRLLYLQNLGTVQTQIHEESVVLYDVTGDENQVRELNVCALVATRLISKRADLVISGPFLVCRGFSRSNRAPMCE